jgi:GT2 family glycosyltransferase
MLAIIVLNWNVSALLRQCLRSLQQHPATTHAQHIIVVDNASSDDSVVMVRREFPDVYLVVNATNRGYTGGNNDGLRAATELLSVERKKWRDESLHTSRSTRHDYILILNPDTEVTAGALDEILTYADAHGDVGLVGPQLRYPDGNLQSSKRHFPTLTTTLFESTPLQKIAPSSVRNYFYAQDCPDDSVCDVDWVVGAALFVRHATYEQVGPLDEDTFFMYSEEVDWCKRIKSYGWRIVYNPRATIIHHEAKSSEQISSRRMIYFNTSKVRYLAKHHGTGVAHIARAALLAQYCGEWGIEALKWLVGHKRALRAERMQAYAALIKTGLC